MGLRSFLAAFLLSTALTATPRAVGDGVEVRVREGGRAVLPCRGLNSSHGAQWRHRGEPLPQDTRYHVDRPTGSLIISRARSSDRGIWLCSPHATPVHLLVLESPKAPYLMIDSRRLDAGNQFIPVKENSELSVECIAEGGSPVPGLHWLLLPAPGAAPSPPGLTLQTAPTPLPSSSVTSSVATIPRVLRAHHNATVACIVTHPTLPAPLNASLLLDVQFTPSFAISRVPGFGFPLREGIPVSLKCDVDSNPPSSPVWQKDDGAPPVEQSADGFLNFTAIKREHSGWYKCTTRHLLSQYSSIGYFLNVRFADEVGDLGGAEIESTEAAVEVSVGGAVQLECGTRGQSGCWGRVGPAGRVSPLGPGAPLAIHSVLYQQAGHYRCYAPESDQLNAWRTHNVHLKVTGEPRVLADNLTISAELGEHVDIVAKYCANPGATKVLWLLPTSKVISPGTTLGPITALNVTDGNGTDCHQATLQLSSVQIEHDGDFSLLVWSGRSIGQTTINLNVTGTPVNIATTHGPQLLVCVMITCILFWC